MSTRRPMTPEARAVRARLGNASRKHGPDHPVTAELRAEWEGERWLSAVIEALGAERPPLSDNQQSRFMDALRRAMR